MTDNRTDSRTDNRPETLTDCLVEAGQNGLKKGSTRLPPNNPNERIEKRFNLPIENGFYPAGSEWIICNHQSRV